MFINRKSPLFENGPASSAKRHGADDGEHPANYDDDEQQHHLNPFTSDHVTRTSPPAAHFRQQVNATNKTHKKLIYVLFLPSFVGKIKFTPEISSRKFY